MITDVHNAWQREGELDGVQYEAWTHEPSFIYNSDYETQIVYYL